MKGLFNVKLQLPNGSKVTLDEDISLDEKKKIVEELIELWMPTIESNWYSNSIKFFLDNLGNYLVWHKEADIKNKQDKEILSVKKIEQMEGKRRANSIPFSSLSNKNKEILGFSERGAD